MHTCRSGWRPAFWLVWPIMAALGLAHDWATQVSQLIWGTVYLGLVCRGRKLAPPVAELYQGNNTIGIDQVLIMQRRKGRCYVGSYRGNHAGHLQTWHPLKGNWSWGNFRLRADKRVLCSHPLLCLLIALYYCMGHGFSKREPLWMCSYCRDLKYKNTGTKFLCTIVRPFTNHALTSNILYS